MTHMDAYTILYQAKESMIEEKGLYEILKDKGNGDIKTLADDLINDTEAIRGLAIEGLERGICKIQYEFPPNVSRRMQKYYKLNKESLIANFSTRMYEAIRSYSV